MKRRTNLPINTRVLEFALMLIGIVSLIAAIIWLVKDPGYEALIAALTGIAELAGAFVLRAKSRERSSGDARSDSSQTNTLSDVPLQRPLRAEHFTGRERELAQLLDALRPGRVVTLCGPGGIGKSALAAEAIWTLAPGGAPPTRFPDGIVSHSFYHQPEAALALEHLARTFAEEPQPAPKEAARRALAGRQALILLDGTEAADDLSSVLEVCGGCGVLVTSRRSADAAGAFQIVTRLPPREAVALLRAWAGPWAADGSAAREICEWAGGLPLAVRLVGRYLAQRQERAEAYLEWLRVSPLQALAQGERRAESVPLLLERSVAQVSERAREALGVAGVLALRSFDRAAVAAGLDVGVQEAAQALGELVSYGLLGRQGERHLVSHALVHAYARKRVLVDKVAVTNLATYYAMLAEEESVEGAEGHARLDKDRAHIMVVLGVCGRADACEETVHLAWAVEGYLDLQGHWTEQIRAIEEGLEAAQTLGWQYDEGALLARLGNAYLYLGEVHKAIDYYQRALTISQEIGDRRGEGTDLGNLGDAYCDLGEVHKAIDYHRRALSIAQEIGDRGGEGARLGNLGIAYSVLGEMHKAIEYYERALLIAQKIGDRRRESIGLGNLGNAHRALGEVEKAIEYHQRALTISQEIGDRRGEGADLGNLGLAYSGLGEVDKAIRYYERSLTIAQEIGDRRGEGNHLGNLGLAYSALGEVDKAIEHTEAALTIFEEIKDPRADQARRQLADLRR